MCGRSRIYLILNVVPSTELGAFMMRIVVASYIMDTQR
jgi:hypothetical protein